MISIIIIAWPWWFLDDDCTDADSLTVLIIMIMIIPPDRGEGDVGGEEEEETNEGEQGDDQGGQVQAWKIFSTIWRKKKWSGWSGQGLENILNRFQDKKGRLDQLRRNDQGGQVQALKIFILSWIYLDLIYNNFVSIRK